MTLTKRIFITRASFVLSILLLAGCEKAASDTPCLSFSNAPVLNVDGPNTGLVNQVINLTVSFGCYNGCGNFGNFENTTKNDTTFIRVIAKYQGCFCQQYAPILQTIYKFKASQPGTYYIKFWQAENNFITQTLSVQ